MEEKGPNWPTAIVALGFLGFVAAIFLVVYRRDGVDAIIKVWGVIGTLVGVVTGAIPSYFFKQSADKNATDANALRLAADERMLERARSFGLRA